MSSEKVPGSHIIHTKKKLVTTPSDAESASIQNFNPSRHGREARPSSHHDFDEPFVPTFDLMDSKILASCSKHVKSNTRSRKDPRIQSVCKVGSKMGGATAQE